VAVLVDSRIDEADDKLGEIDVMCRPPNSDGFKASAKMAGKAAIKV
jgi:hypothetical protein